MHLHRHGQLSLPFSKKQQAEQQRFLIPRELAEVMAGACAEIVQVAALYPIDTIKVGYWPQSARCTPRLVAGSAIEAD
jgi:hypothetical protein